MIEEKVKRGEKESDRYCHVDEKIRKRKNEIEGKDERMMKSMSINM